MKKSIFVLLCLTFLTSEIMKSQVCYGIRGEGSEVIISVTSSVDYLNPPTNQWLSMLFTVGWSNTLGADVIQSTEALNGFPFILDGNTNFEDEETAMFYRKVVSTSSGYIHSLNSGETVDIFKITVSHPSISTGDFHFVANPPSSLLGGTATFQNTFPGEQFQPQTCNLILTASSVILPVELTEFKAELKGENTLLNWITATEINTDYYYIEKSIDAQSWKNIGKVTAQGNTNESTNYYYTDEKAFRDVITEKLFYRLKIVDKDGSQEYSSIRKVQRSPTQGISFFPNPAQGNINLKIESDIDSNATLEICDQTGKIVLMREFGVNTGLTNLPLSLEKLATGIYFTKVILNGQIFNDRIVVNN